MLHGIAPPCSAEHKEHDCQQNGLPGDDEAWLTYELQCRKICEESDRQNERQQVAEPGWVDVHRVSAEAGNGFAQHPKVVDSDEIDSRGHEHELEAVKVDDRTDDPDEVKAELDGGRM